MKRERILSTLAGLALAGGALVLYADSAPAPPDPAAAPARRVRVAEVSEVAGSRPLRLSGVARAARRGRPSFAVSGRLVERPVEVGDAVAAGAVLGRLDGEELGHALAVAEGAVAELAARHAQLESELARSERLFAADAATAEEVERARTAVDALAASLDAARSRRAEARRRRSEAVLAAPWAGTVTAVHAEPGDFLAAGAPVVELSADGALEVELGVPETARRGLAAGDEVRVDLPLLGPPPVRGAIAAIGRASGADTLFPVRLTLADDPRLAAGVTVEVVLELPVTGAVSVPLVAVLDPGGSDPAVLRLDGERVHRVPVEIGHLDGERVAVRGALAAGDRVVVTGHGSLVDGDRVEVLP